MEGSKYAKIRILSKKEYFFCDEPIVRRNKDACLSASRCSEKGGGFHATLFISKDICDRERSNPIVVVSTRKYNQSATQAAGVMVGQQKNRTAAVCRSVLYGIILMWNKLSAIVEAPNERQLPQC